MRSEAKLGSTAGAIFQFRNGTLASIEFPRAGLALPIREALSPLPKGLSDLACESLIVDSGSNSSTLNLQETQRATQQADSLNRSFFLESKLTSVAPFDRLTGPRPTITSILRIEFSPGFPVEWTLTMAGVETWKVQPSSGIDVKFRGGPRLLVSSSAANLSTSIRPSAVTNGDPHGDEIELHAKISLDATGGHVELRLTCVGATIVSNTVVLCRPDQLRPAAAALSAVPGSSYVPLIVVPPITTGDEQHSTLFAEYRSLVDKTLEGSGELARRDFASAPNDEKLDFFKETLRRRQLLELLAPRRSLAKRNLMLRHALKDLGVTRAILLFEPSINDLSTEPPEHDLDERKAESVADLSLLPREIERLVLTPGESTNDAVGYRDLRDLALHCARWLDVDVDSVHWIEAATPNAGDLIVGLHQARLQGALLAIPDTDQGLRLSTVLLNGPAPNNNHIVLVEAQEHAKCLLGALYAAHLRTRIVVSPVPSLEAVESALQGMQQAVVYYDASFREVAGSRKFSLNDISSFARKFFLSDGRSSALQAITKAVTAAVHPQVVNAVGDAQLTVFTIGLPYGFVRAGDKEWSDKAIGHVIEDPDLQLLNDFASQEALDPLAAFNLIIDPGYFQHSETEDVQASLHGRASRTLLLKSDDIEKTFGSQSVTNLARVLPVEFLFFNTHGSDQGILLGSYELLASFIPQWMQLPERPIVFNNSCLSWTGVGRQFVRIGSRAYVGTLWSVDAKDAAEVGRSLVQRVTKEGYSLGAALAGFQHVAPETSRAYIAVGCAPVRFPNPNHYRATGSTLASVVELNCLLTAVTDARSDAHGGQAASYLYEEYLRSRRALEATRPAESGLAIARLILREVEELLERRNRLNPTVTELLDVVSEGERALRATNLAANLTNDVELKLLRTRALLREQDGDIDGAIEDLQACITRDETAKEIRASARFALSDIMLNRGKFDEVLAICTQMRDAARADNDEQDQLMALGRIAQAMKRIPSRVNEGIEAATEGEELAKRLGLVKSQATFALDLAGLFTLARRFGDALTAGERALRLARRNGDPTAELAAYGTLGGIHRVAGRLDKARHMATQGLQRATELGLPQRANAFLADLAAIQALDAAEVNRDDNQLEGAVTEVLDSLERVGRSVPLTPRSFQLRQAIRLAIRAQNFELILRAMLLTPATLIANAADGAAIGTILYQTLKEAALKLPRDEALPIFGVVYEAAVKLLEDKSTAIDGSASSLRRFVAEIAGMLALALIGDRERALAMAIQMDKNQSTGSEFLDTIELVLRGTR